MLLSMTTTKLSKLGLKAPASILNTAADRTKFTSRGRGHTNGPMNRSEVADIITRTVRGDSPAKIGRDMGTAQEVICHTLNPFRDLLDQISKPELLEEYRTKKLAILEQAESLALGKVMELLRRDDLTAKEAVYAFREIFAASRLTAGQVTSLSGEIRFTAPAELTDMLAAKSRELDITPARKPAREGGSVAKEESAQA